MIRRFETYAFLPGTPQEARRRVAEVLAGAGRYIPEVLDCFVGWNRSEAPAELVWEQAYDSPESYRRYMVHPYHADLIDRYVLPDSPERVVETMRGAGLFGYHCEQAGYRLAGGARRVVLLRLADAIAAETFADTAARHSRAAGALLSVVGANTMASCWFDGETPLPIPPPKWTHVWEQGFADFEAMEAHVAGAGRAVLDEAGVERWTELRYVPEPG